MAKEDLTGADQASSVSVVGSGKFHLPAGTPLSDALEECNCLLRTGIAVFEETHEEMTEGQWAGLYVLRMALEVFGRIHVATVRAAEEGATV